MNTPSADWQYQLAEAFSSVAALCAYLELDVASLPLLPDYKKFPLRVPKSFVDCMQKGNPDDPLLRQILPVNDELLDVPGYSIDPVGDLNALAEAGVIHKYQGRVLLIVTGGCAVHCRYCFRRHFPYNEVQLSGQKLAPALAYISAREDIKEVILSGGDPLLLNDAKIDNLLNQISRIPHVQRIRIHSRIPIVLPARITTDLLTILEALPQQVIMVVHANHGNELSRDVAFACQRLRQHSITLMNQSVLLKGINDDSDTLCKLSEKLFEIGILPYYLHKLDQAAGVGHFEVSEQFARQLILSLQEKLPGYLVPKLVKEQAGAAYKIRLA